MRMCDCCGKKAHFRDEDAKIKFNTIDFRWGTEGQYKEESIHAEELEICTACREKLVEQLKKLGEEFRKATE